MRSLKTFVIGILTIATLLYVYTAMVGPRPAQAQTQIFAPLQCNTFKPFSVSANTQLFTANNTTGPAGAAPNPQFIYICSLIINASAAQTVSIVEGTGTTCATNTAAVIGNNAAAGGLSLGVNGGQNIGGGIGPIAKTATAGDNVCLYTSGGVISGVISGAQASF
jgi:hypothetical protein